MWELIALILFVLIITVILKWIGIAIYVLFVYIILPVVALSFIFIVLRSIYHFYNPTAKKAYLSRKAKEAEDTRTRKERAEAADLARKRKLEEEERQRKQSAINKELERQRYRDSEQQETPYTYQIGKHANESLAIRYGIANQAKKTKEYWYHAQGGEMKRNPDRDSFYFEPCVTIQLRKSRKVSKDLYEVFLTDYRDRPAKAIIEAGSEYVKTFYPFDDSWFEKHAELERTLKGNGSFTLKELATFHVQKIK